MERRKPGAQGESTGGGYVLGDRGRQSRDFNPIEKMWSDIKNRLRDDTARSRSECSEAITQASYGGGERRTRMGFFVPRCDITIVKRSRAF